MWLLIQVNLCFLINDLAFYQLCHLSLAVPALSLAVPALSLAVPALSLAVPALSLAVPAPVLYPCLSLLYPWLSLVSMISLFCPWYVPVCTVCTSADASFDRSNRWCWWLRKLQKRWVILEIWRILLVLSSLKPAAKESGFCDPSVTLVRKDRAPGMGNFLWVAQVTPHPLPPLKLAKVFL